MKILITGARSYVAWSMLKLAGKQENLYVYIGDSDSKSLSFKSSLYDKKVIFPSPKLSFELFKNFILEYIIKEKITNIFPSCEEVFYFSMLKKELSEIGCDVFTDNFDNLKEIHSKYKFNKKLKNFNIGIPKTRIVNKKSELINYINNQDKYIFKYEYSRFANNIYTNFSSKFKHINKIGEFEGKLLAQEYIIGKNICSFGIAKNGKLVGNIVYENIMSYKGGAGTYLKSFYHKKINSFVENFVENTNFHGFISFDFIENNKDLYVIECNPRITSGIHLYDNNKDLSDIIYNNHKYKTFFSNKIIFKTFLLANIFFNFGNIFKHYPAFRFKNDVLYDEKKVFFYQIYIFIYYIYLSKKKGKTITEVSSGDIEYNG